MTLVAPTEPLPLSRLGSVHFVGIGGAGMSGIARVFLQHGVGVSGSDSADGPTLAELADLGARVRVGHAAANIDGADTVVVSSAVREDNPEVATARARGLRVIPRATALGALLLERRGVAVAGTHGKTTTTAMLTAMLGHLGADPGYVIGGKLVTTGLGADAGSGDLMVVEADESDGSFLALTPSIAVVTNVEADHLDNYGDVAEIRHNFARFADRVTATLVVGIDDPGGHELADAVRRRGRRVRTYGESSQADYRVSGIAAEGFTTVFTLHGPKGAPVRCAVAAPGRHNALNATAALVVAEELGYDHAAAADGLAEFTGAARRFEFKGEANGVRVYDSYAHHPTELAADLRAARAALASGETADAASGRIVALFQPHLYSRTRVFAAEFARALTLADEVLVLPIYAAREDPEEGVTSELITARVEHERVRLFRRRDPVAIAGAVAETARPGDLVLTMGAGDITELGAPIVAALAAAAPAGA